MKGSEKQVKWAEDIKHNLIRVYEGVKSADPANGAAITAAIAKLDAIEEAAIIIELYKGIKFTGDMQHDFAAVAACHRTMTAGERAMVLPRVGL